MHHEEHDDLWELLHKARPVKASPFFAHNVLRAIREDKPQREGVVGWIFSRWGAVAAGACALLVAGFFLLPKAEPPSNIETLAEHVAASPEYAVISNLDELLAAEENSVWLDQTLY